METRTFMSENSSLEEKIVSLLQEKGWKIASAESCSGGMIASRLVNVSGVSDVFEEGYITYSNAAKHKLLGVSKQSLGQYGAVSSQVAGEMALGAARQARARAAIAVTGIAGPGGGTPQKPVGLVYIGCYVDGKVFVTENHFQGSRQEIRTATTQAALSLLLEKLTRD
ncbi:MAG: CinA family protein [Lachnospiraceae bacterium]|nr:CinA family protein [Lachnospiraceae bacterium]MCI9095361.1 CinA family protein [Lachnospiraceae bacterium]MCI9204786.1 CinA family protein [Lachnospiraceae bacterium]